MATQVETIEAPQAAALTEPCLNCGAPLSGEYCHRCGQKRIHKHEFSVKHFFGHLLHEITHLDSNKILKTLRDLVFKPGLLAEEYLAGRKGRYINPIRVYLTFSAIYFLFAWGALLDFRGVPRESFRPARVVAIAKKKNVDPQVVVDKIFQKAEKYSAALRFASVLVSGLFLSVLYFGMKKYYVEHLIFSLYFYSFDFLCKTLFALVIVGASAAHVKLPGRLLDLFYPVAFVYLLFALRRVYKESWGKTALKAVVLFVCEVLLFMAVNMAGFIASFILV
ncbi:MAG TPA: DUF3667 domain-containing protein [Pyrinomonadaceae bacterium]|nr:DUF3667 domain-containing protein [Pyrinomonadaceae bacterium]